MIAGGIGITPMIANLRSMRARGDTRRVILFYANKAWSEVTFREELEALARDMDLKVVHVLETPPDDWDGESGFLDREILERHLSEETHGWAHMLCGPPPMTEAARAALLEMSVPLWRIDSEIFDLV